MLHKHGLPCTALGLGSPPTLALRSRRVPPFRKSWPVCCWIGRTSGVPRQGAAASALGARPRAQAVRPAGLW
ncbi:MAG: hypothetical protein MZV70_75920 [Desulfobacterales bacterium]|nr:hypothetical protein [Desulfobacterales bacterium]